MQGSIALLKEKVTAAAVLAAARCVTFGGAYPAAGAAIYGVTTMPAVAVGDLATVDLMGTTLAESGGTVTAGGAVKTDATGRVVDQGGTGVIVGRALTASAAAGTIVEVLLFPGA